MEKGGGKRRTQTKCRANEKRRFAAQSTSETEETKAERRTNWAAIEVESPMKSMMEKGKGETRNTDEMSR